MFKPSFLFYKIVLLTSPLREVGENSEAEVVKC